MTAKNDVPGSLPAPAEISGYQDTGAPAERPGEARENPATQTQATTPPQTALLQSAPPSSEQSSQHSSAAPTGFTDGGQPRRPAPQIAPPNFTPTLPPLDLDGLGKNFIDPADIAWKRVSPKYVKVRMISRAIWSVLLVALAALPLVFTEILGWWQVPLWLSATLLGLVLLLQIWLMIIVHRQVRALGYSERADHLLTRKGIMFRSVRALPYGRIQYIDVNSGPIENAVGLCHIEVKTAGAGGLTLPGLERTDAEKLREVLTDLSEAKMVGL